MPSDFLYIGHRGTIVKYDENTLSAFEKAVHYGADYIEFDIRKTKDEKLVIIHDTTLDRTTDGFGFISNLTYSEIQVLRTKAKKEQIPLLSAVLDKLKGKTNFMIDLKDENLDKQVIKITNEKGLIGECIFSGRKLTDLVSIKSYNAQSKICYNITKGKDLTLRDFLKRGVKERLPVEIDFFSLRSNLITQKFIELCHRYNIMALSWDFLSYNKPLNQIKSLIEIGIDGILFDNYKNIPIIKRWLKKI